MIIKSFRLALTGAAFLGLAACASQYQTMEELKNNGDYWQRANVSDATFQEGPKAQQMLHRDISRCVTELRELDRLNPLRDKIPADNGADGNPPDPKTAAGDLAQWASPERDGYLLAEQSDYQDFETCMQAKGWQRMEHVPYDIAQKSRVNYIETMTGKTYEGDQPPAMKTDEAPDEGAGKGPYDNLNQ